MRLRAPAVLVAFLLAGMASCSLLTDVSSLGGADASATDATPDVTEDVPVGVDASTDVSADTADANVDAGAWAFVWSVGNTTPAAPGPLTVNAPAAVQPGDLLVFGCDTSFDAHTITITGLPTGAATQSGATTTFQTIVSWSIAKTSIPNLTVTAQPQSTGEFLDCSLNAYRGGTKATLVDHFASNGTDAGLVTCQPVITQKGGLAYYIAVRSKCAGIPLDPHFIQRETFQGNPNGDYVPADGTKVGTQLADCSQSTGDWLCLLVSLSP